MCKEKSFKSAVEGKDPVYYNVTLDTLLELYRQYRTTGEAASIECIYCFEENLIGPEWSPCEIGFHDGGDVNGDYENDEDYVRYAKGRRHRVYCSDISSFSFVSEIYFNDGEELAAINLVLSARCGNVLDNYDNC